jgi:hypothetical protein
MSRIEARRLAKESAKADKTFNMTAKSLENTIKAAREDERNKTIIFVVKCYSAAVALVMRDKWGFGKERLPRLINQINDMFDSFLQGYLSIDDARNTISEEIGIDILRK